MKLQPETDCKMDPPSCQHLTSYGSSEVDSGWLQNIEVTSFVKPSWIPQLADAVSVLEGLNNRQLSAQQTPQIGCSTTTLLESGSQPKRNGESPRCWSKTHCNFYERIGEPHQSLRELTKQLLDLGAWQVALGDTTGMGDPALVERVLAAMDAAQCPHVRARDASTTPKVALAISLKATGLEYDALMVQPGWSWWICSELAYWQCSNRRHGEHVSSNGS